MAEVNYQSLLSKGAYQVTGYVTYGSRIPTSGPGASEKDIRGYIDASGKFQFNPYWSVSGSIRAATDRTFLRRYGLSRDEFGRAHVGTPVTNAHIVCRIHLDNKKLTNKQ